MASPALAISVIIPVFNMGRYLCQCLDSVVKQALPDIEIICINDGSTDGSLEILQSYAAKDGRIRVVSKPNGGQSQARNLGISLAKGKYLAFVDADDAVDAELLQKAYGHAVNRNADLVIYDYVKFRTTQEITKKQKETSSLASVIPSDRDALLAHMGVVWTKLVRKEWLQSQDIVFPEGFIYEDILVHWQMLVLAENLTVLPERLYFHRVNESATTFRTDKKRSDSIYIYDMLKVFLHKQNVYDKYREFFLYRQLSNFYAVADTIDSQYKQQIVDLIRERLGEEEWSFILSEKRLNRPVRDFFLTLRGDVVAETRRALWLFARRCRRLCRSF